MSRAEERKWFTEQMTRDRARGSEPGWATRQVEAHGLEAAVDEIELINAATALDGINLRRHPWSGGPEARNAVHDARAAVALALRQLRNTYTQNK